MTPDEEKELLETVKEIKTAVVGNKPFGIDGLVHRVTRYEKKVDEIETKQTKVLKWAVALGTVMGILFHWITGILFH